MVLNPVVRITWIEPYFDLILNEIPLNVKTVLEVGTGSGVLGFIIKKTRNCELYGIEPFNYELSHYDRIFNYTWKEYFLRHDKRFDLIISSETIEHMEKKEALNFLEQAKQRANKVIISTPFKFQQQPPYDDNPFQVHKCLITPKDFKNSGYKIKYIGRIATRFYSVRTYGKFSFIPISNMVGIYES